MGKALVDLTGQHFGRLTVLNRGPEVGSERRVSWVCTCECGTSRVIPSASLRNGRVQSCGCLRGEQRADSNRTHGRRHTAMYKIWCGMKGRCGNPNHSGYQWYGARGISVCEAWRNSFEQFESDIGPRPSRQHSIDRINNDGNYEPGNVRWATASVQQMNRRPRKRLAAIADLVEMVGEQELA